MKACKAKHLFSARNLHSYVRFFFNETIVHTTNNPIAALHTTLVTTHKTIPTTPSVERGWVVSEIIIFAKQIYSC